VDVSLGVDPVEARLRILILLFERPEVDLEEQMAVVWRPLQIQLHGFVAGEADGRGFWGLAGQVDEVQVDVFHFFLALGDRLGQEGQAPGVCFETEPRAALRAWASSSVIRKTTSPRSSPR